MPGAAVSDSPQSSHHTIGSAHSIRIPTPTDASDYLLVLRVEPSAPYCQLAVDVDGIRRRSLELHLRAVVCCHLPWTSLNGTTDLEVTLDTSETVDPEEGSRLLVLDLSLVKFRPPGPSLRPDKDMVPELSPQPLAPPASDAELLSHFVSFGDNCEFGLFQRRHGFDAPSFLRLAAMPYDGLCLGLQEKFEACYNPDELFAEVFQYTDGRREYILKHQRYAIFWHTLVGESDVAAPTMMIREYQKLCMLLRMLVEGLCAGNRIIVYKGNAALGRPECERLARLLAPYGRNGLLVVAPAERRSDVGRVVVAGNNLMLGYIDKFLPHDAANMRASNVWMTICRNARLCWNEQQTSPAVMPLLDLSTNPA